MVGPAELTAPSRARPARGGRSTRWPGRCCGSGRRSGIPGRRRRSGSPAPACRATWSKCCGRRSGRSRATRPRPRAGPPDARKLDRLAGAIGDFHARPAACASSDAAPPGWPAVRLRRTRVTVSPSIAPRSGHAPRAGTPRRRVGVAMLLQHAPSQLRCWSAALRLLQVGRLLQARRSGSGPARAGSHRRHAVDRALPFLDVDVRRRRGRPHEVRGRDAHPGDVATNAVPSRASW